MTKTQTPNDQLTQAAITFASPVTNHKQARHALDDAYVAWRVENNVSDFIKKGTIEWDRMMEATKTQYESLQKAKRRERYWRDRIVQLAGRTP